MRELRNNEILKLASAFLRPSGTRPPSEVLMEFIDRIAVPEVRPKGKGACRPTTVGPTHREEDVYNHIPI
ncbi:hypothetical protein D3C87_2106410 [compost metagenome]